MIMLELLGIHTPVCAGTHVNVRMVISHVHTQTAHVLVPTPRLCWRSV